MSRQERTGHDSVPVPSGRDWSRSPLPPLAEPVPQSPIRIPYPYNRGNTMFVESADLVGTTEMKDIFYAEEAVAEYDQEMSAYFIKKKPEDAEIQVSKLPDKAKKLF